MNAKKIAKLVKALVEVEVAKKHEHFLTKTFPKILSEEVNKKLNKKVVQETTQQKEIDPFSLANAVLDEDRTQVEKKNICKESRIKRSNC